MYSPKLIHVYVQFNCVCAEFNEVEVRNFKYSLEKQLAQFLVDLYCV